MTANNSQLDFRLKIYVLELDTTPVTIAPPATTQQLSLSSSAAAAAPTTIASDDAAAAAFVSNYVTRTIDTFDISRNNIDYRAEGNANIVLAIPQRCQVLRLPKKSKRLHTFILFISVVSFFLLTFKSTHGTNGCSFVFLILFLRASFFKILRIQITYI